MPVRDWLIDLLIDLLIDWLTDISIDRLIDSLILTFFFTQRESLITYSFADTAQATVGHIA